MSGYERLHEISQGGMGTVELVLKQDGRFQRLYARKRLHRQHRDDRRFRLMFMDEARLAGLVRHPNVVSVLDVGEDEEGPFLVMDFVDGLPVSRLVARAAESGESIPLQVCARIGMEAARGLHAVHEARSADGQPLGIVHRDVSPRNVLVGFDGTVRVSDFGIAKALGNATQTTTGILKGSFGYLSPEQLRFEEPDRRSDLFSLGVVLYELLSGERLYGDEDAAAGARRILNEPPPDLGEVRDDVPAKLVELLFELMAKDPARRPASANEVAARLEAILAALISEVGAVDLAEHMKGRFGEVRLEQQVERTRQIERLASRSGASGRTAPEEPVTAVATPAGTARRRQRRWAAVGAVAVALGVGTVLVARRADRPVPAAAPSAGPFPVAGRRTVWAGGWHSCGLQDRQLFCWGKNNEGQVGAGNSIDSLTRSPVAGVDGAVSVALGFFHTCACDRHGKTWCWGRNGDGQLGTGDGRPSSRPVRVPAPDGCRQVAAGSRHACVLAAGGAVLCWGINTDGQSGGASPAPVLAPTEIPGVSPAEELDADGEFSCARRGGTVLCWGNNAKGQLGDGTTVSRPSPAPVSGIDDAVELALGRTFACARRRSGRIACWGDNGMGQLGDGTRTARHSPVEVVGLSEVAQLAAGGSHACALRRVDELRCWGANWYGQLGNGTQKTSPVPLPVIGLSQFVSVSVGDTHTCARHRYGLSCWGLNETGQLGDGTTDAKPQPVSAAGFRQFH